MIQTIRHIGSNQFEAIMEDGKVMEVGTNLCGMIRYTYFENFENVCEGWSVEHSKLMEDYHKKIYLQIIKDRKTG